MTDTLEPVAAANEEVDQEQLAQRLLAQAKEQGVELVGPDGLLNQLTKRVLETALEEEMAEHLGYDKHDPVGRNFGNSRNGVRSKTVLTEIGPVEIDVPRDVDASFQPQIVKKRQRRLSGVDEIVLSLTARGLTTGEISAHFAEVYGASVIKDTVSKITDKVVEEMNEWCNRPLDPVYPVIFIDAIVVKVRDGQVRNKSIYVVIGVTVHGERDILGLWAGNGGEGAKFWLQVLTELKNRGVQDVCIAVCDGLKALPDAITTVWELAVVQACIIHLIRNTFRFASRKYWDQIAHDLRPVYTAASEAEALARFEEFEEKWGKPYPAIRPAVAQRLDRVRAVLGLRRRDPQSHLLNERHREHQRPLPPSRPGPRPLSKRPGRPEMPLPGHPIPRPHRTRQGTMGVEVEARPERLRHHVRRPDPPGRKLIMRPDQIHRLSDTP
jgi:putative transposase